MSEDFEEGLVSVITPTCNRAWIIEETLGSVRQQSYRPIEVVVVDDGSTDETEEQGRARVRRVLRRGPDGALRPPGAAGRQRRTQPRAGGVAWRVHPVPGLRRSAAAGQAERPGRSDADRAAGGVRLQPVWDARRRPFEGLVA
ncbi:MAG: glycosyltransferase [Xanthomonadales bacterium]|nr:glycosyltransferase [Xanthomonadales bacterium]